MNLEQPVDKFCCCFTLQTGGIVAGWFNIILSIVGGVGNGPKSFQNHSSEIFLWTTQTNGMFLQCMNSAFNVAITNKFIFFSSENCSFYSDYRDCVRNLFVWHIQCKQMVHFKSFSIVQSSS